MYNWSNIDEKQFKKKNPEGYKLWRLTQLINYGLDGEKLDREEVKKAWPKIKDQLDPDRRKTIEFYLWGGNGARNRAYCQTEAISGNGTSNSIHPPKVLFDRRYCLKLLLSSPP